MRSKPSKKPPQKSSQSIQMDKLMNLSLTTRLVIGECEMEIADILKLGQGAVLELNTLAQDPLEVWVNESLIAKAESVVVNENIAARITEVSSPDKRLQNLSQPK